MRIKKITQNTRDFNITDAVTDGGTDLNKDTFNGMQDNIEEEFNKIGSCASFSKTNNQELVQNTKTTILFNTTDYVDNECFELQSDGKIKVLKDISRVQVNYNIRCTGGKTLDLIYYCASTEDAGFNTSLSINTATLSGSGVLKVKKNSLISVSVYSSSDTAVIQGYTKEWVGINLCVLK